MEREREKDREGEMGGGGGGKREHWSSSISEAELPSLNNYIFAIYSTGLLLFCFTVVNWSCS